MEVHHTKDRERLRDRFSKAMGRERSEGIVDSHVTASTVDVEGPAADDQELRQDVNSISPNTSDQTSALAKQYPKASLLGIPGELRNQIYRYTLLEDRLVKLNPQNHKLPGLLCTCRQIQDEATEIYQTENNFQIDAWDMKLCIPENYAEHWMSSLRHSHFWITLRGIPNWENFMVWLKRYSTGEVPGLASGQPTDEAEILAQAFEIVHSMRKLLPFDRLQPVLDAWKNSVVLAGANFLFP